MLPPGGLVLLLPFSFVNVQRFSLGARLQLSAAAPLGADVRKKQAAVSAPFVTSQRAHGGRKEDQVSARLQFI